MKASDFVTTSEQKVAASERLLFTEQTDAVNTGIVDSADKKGVSALNGASAVRKAAKAGVSNAVLAATSKKHSDRATGQGTGGTGLPDGTGESDGRTFRTRLGNGAKGAAKGFAAKAVHSTLEGSELEGVDDAYYKGKAAVRAARYVKGRLSASKAKRTLSLDGRDPTQPGSPLGGLSEKKYLKKAADPAAVKRRAQAAGYVKRRTYQAAAKNAAAAASKTAAHSAATAGLKGAAGGGLKAVAGAFGGLLAPLLGVLLVVVFIAVLGGASGSSTQQQNQVSLNGLSGVQLEVAQVLSQAGYGPVQIAAVMGNIQGESSEWDPTVGDASSGYGLYQFTGSSYTAFANWCDANGKQKDSATAQTEYIASNLQGLWGTSLHNSGYYGAITDYAGKDVSYEAWQSSTDVGFATYAFMVCYERPDSGPAPSSFKENRLPAAQQFYALLTGGAGGLGEDYANADETGKAIVNAALTTPWAGPDKCATWVTWVYQAAGLGTHGGNGNSMLAGYATSSDWANIKVGQIVSAQIGSGSAGAIYGHVGIYIGDGKIMDNITSGLRTIPLTDWIAENGRGWVVYGWPW